MADDRRSSRKPGRPARGRSGPGGPTRGGRPGGNGRPEQAIERRQLQREKVAAIAKERAEEKRHTRLTGRAAILVLVLAVLAVSYASSLRAYLQQRSHLNELQSQIADRKDSIADLGQEKERWQDDAYLAQQARLLGYVPRGETPYVVVDVDGDPLEAAEFSDPATIGQQEDPAWYDDMWESVTIAGDPPTTIPAPPKKKIKAPREDLEDDTQ